MRFSRKALEHAHIRFELVAVANGVAVVAGHPTAGGIQRIRGLEHGAAAVHGLLHTAVYADLVAPVEDLVAPPADDLLGRHTFGAVVGSQDIEVRRDDHQALPEGVDRLEEPLLFSARLCHEWISYPGTTTYRTRAADPDILLKVFG